MRAPTLHEQFADLDKQGHAVRLGMWVFLGSETMLFAGLFALYAGYRIMYPAGFAAGAAGDNLVFGTINLFLLLTASLAATLGLLAVRAAALRRAAGLFSFAAASGVAFLALKTAEYVQHFHEGIFPGGGYDRLAASTPRGADIFYTLYFLSTGLHALHLFVGIGLMLWIASGCLGGRYSPANRARVENSVLYWHVVDIFWMFLWPLFYLMRG